MTGTQKFLPEPVHGGCLSPLWENMVSFSRKLWIAKHGLFSSAFHRIFTWLTPGSISFFLSKVSPLAFDFAFFPLFDLQLWLFPIILSVQSNCLLWVFFHCNLWDLGMSALIGSSPLKGFFFFLQEKLGWILFTALRSFSLPLPWSHYGSLLWHQVKP